MTERFLGIDTSNYRTSAAVYEPESGFWQNEGGLLTVPAGAIGLRQSDALFQHTVRLHEKIEALPQGKVSAIGVSTRPRAVEGSYMPCICPAFWQERAPREARRICCLCRFSRYRISRDILRRQRFRLADYRCWTSPFWHGIYLAAQANCCLCIRERTDCPTALVSAGRPTWRRGSSLIARERCSACCFRRGRRWMSWRYPLHRKKDTVPRWQNAVFRSPACRIRWKINAKLHRLHR